MFLPDEEGHIKAIEHILHVYEGMEGLVEFIKKFHYFMQKSLDAQISTHQKTERLIKVFREYVETDASSQPEDALEAVDNFLE